MGIPIVAQATNINKKYFMMIIVIIDIYIFHYEYI